MGGGEGAALETEKVMEGGGGGGEGAALETEKVMEGGGWRGSSTRNRKGNGGWGV